MIETIKGVDMVTGNIVVMLLLGLFSGVLNTMAGGASLMTLPALMGVGLSVDMANGTNRVGLWSLSVAAAWQFYRAGDLRLESKLVGYLVWMILGSLIGTYGALVMDPTLFRVVATVIILGMLLVSLFDKLQLPKSWIATTSAQHVWCFAIGVYAGWFHAGVGILLMMFFMMQDCDLRTTNAFKTFLIAVFTLPTCLIYVSRGLVAWPECSGLVVGGFLGSLVGVRYFAGRFLRVSKALMSLSILIAVWKMMEPVWESF